MCVRYLGFVLLVWFPGVLHAQRADNSCSAPRLNYGYFVPNHETYAHGVKLTYACEKGYKPVVAGRWWATSTCQNGTWFHEPKCIDEEDCITPEIPNANYTTSPEVWYQNGHVFRVTCNKGYEPKNRAATTRCNKGRWTSVLVCEKRYDSCGEPPRIPHAVIKHEYKEVFAADTQVYYECEDGYTVERAEDTKSIFCVLGNWTDGPTCRTGSTGQGGSAEVGTDGGHTSFVTMEIQPAAGDKGTGSTGQGGSAGVGTDGGHTSFVTMEIQPAAGGSSTTSGSNGGDSSPSFVPISRCGTHPVLENGVVMEVNQMSLKYQCSGFYTQVGLDTVVCHNDGTWSKLPECKESFCVLDPAQHVGSNVIITTKEYLKEGEKKYFPCIWHSYFSLFQCTERRITMSRCKGTGSTGQGGSAEVGTDGGHTTSVTREIQPAAGGSSTTSGSNGGDSSPSFVPISRCGTHPFLENGIVVDVNQMFLKNQCNGFYTQVGPDTVVCHNDGTWSKLPECKESFCVLDPAQYVGSNVIITTKEYLKEGEKKYFPCNWDRWFSIFQCTERRITMSRCNRY
ncbi:coagulation factor XIII B chain-like isoform X14 [Dicentrarchus labrax]|uniref:coagulation factor XIII B chain-like isoform X12 n=1 Tax=Dicentrarchus labrax TaxID=13489 RepID=UPI0021F5F034|nr:coagulation factor XIII B chain-like isoform X12 [Dicentrarchus labrax]XP_051254012.1 coagulation factor XIII B chain-like isoform X13 [Dicentrarchus labrax]XP_051254016.1 coagulation factor XIII B chain-like isoform X14 [Dicentrarchus labrax]